MKILYDPQVFSTNNYGGVSRYFFELISGMLQNGHDICLPLWKTKNVYFHQSDFLKNELINRRYYIGKKESFFDKVNFKGKLRLTNFLESAGLFYSNEKKCIKFLKNKEYDLVHPTYYNSYFVKYIGNKPFVLTIYDMIHERFSENFKDSTITTNKKFLAHKASTIIAISNSTKQDIIKFLGIPAEKIHVVYLASGMVRSNNYLVKVELPEKYLLYTGQRWHYKNFTNFVKACAPLLKEHNLYLVCTANAFSNDEIALFDSLNVKDRIVHMSGDDNFLAKLYSKALLFVFPSLCEGFGIPVLEAFSCGCPTIVSNISCFKEVCSEAAEYFDPYDVESIYQVISATLNNNDRQKELVELGRKRLLKFSWEKTVSDTIEVYKKTIDNCKFS